MLIVQKHLRAVTEALVGKDVAPIGELLDKIKQLQAENKRLRKALEKYGCHSTECVAEEYPEKWHCICGFEQALAAEK